ncbi:DUF2156 domain-containing protein [bacterium]|nr:DUF2156 domain-containing protein [bacterium]
MQREKLDLKHKKILQPKLHDAHSIISECSFANLYLFRHVHDYEVFQHDEGVFIYGKSYDGSHYIMPTVPIGTLDLDQLRQLMQLADYVFPVPEEALSRFQTDEFKVDFDDGDTDYVYTVEKMATFKGRKLSKKRNLLKQFNRLYAPTSFMIEESLKPDLLKILNAWQEELELPKEETDYYPCVEAIEKKEYLGLCGIIYYVHDEPAGFILSEPLSPDTLALHFAKGLRQYKGLYQYMYNSFAKILSPKYAHLNFEQDLGLLALKAAKSSYIPDMLLKKYRVGLR